MFSLLRALSDLCGEIFASALPPIDQAAAVGLLERWLVRKVRLGKKHLLKGRQIIVFFSLYRAYFQLFFVYATNIRTNFLLISLTGETSSSTTKEAL